MIRITAALECDGCGTTYDDPAEFQRISQLERWIGTVRKEAQHLSIPAAQRWVHWLEVAHRRGDFCPRCQLIAARQDLKA